MAVPSSIEQAIFNAARRLETPEARRLYLEQACGEDRALQARVEALLGVYDREISLPRIRGEGPRAAFSDTPREGPGTPIGPYRLLEQIGEGVMSTVSLGEQTHPHQR